MAKLFHNLVNKLADAIQADSISEGDDDDIDYEGLLEEDENEIFEKQKQSQIKSIEEKDDKNNVKSNTEKTESAPSSNIGPSIPDNDDDDILLEFELYDSPEKNHSEQEDEETKKLQKAFQIIQKISPFFPAQHGIQNPKALLKEIEKLSTEMDELTKQRENKENILKERKQLFIIEKEYQSLSNQLNEKQKQTLQLRSKLTSIQQKKAEFAQKQADIKLSIEESRGNLQRNNSHCSQLQTELSHLLIDQSSAKDQLNSLISHNSELSSKKSEIETNIREQTDKIADIQSEIKCEKERIAQITEQLKSITIKSEDDEMQTNQEDQNEESNLVLEISKQKSILSSMKDAPITQLEEEMSRLQEKLQMIEEHKAIRIPQSEKESDEITAITEALFNYYRGTEGALDQIKQIFGWTEEDMEKLKHPPESGLSGLFKKSVRFINRFSNSWSNWLIEQSEK